MIFRTMKAYGEPLQYSVFVCDLTRQEKLAMQLHLGSIMDRAQDSIVLLDLGVAAAETAVRFEYMGVHRPLPEGGATIV